MSIYQLSLTDSVKDNIHGVPTLSTDFDHTERPKDLLPPPPSPKKTQLCHTEKIFLYVNSMFGDLRLNNE